MPASENNMQRDEEEQPAHSAEKHIERQIGTQKFASFASVRLAYKQQHRGRKRRFELRKAIHISHRNGIEQGIEQPSNPLAQAFGQR